METLDKQRLNPWFSMWFKPRATIQQIIDTDPKRHVLLLAAIFGLHEMLGNASAGFMGDEAPLSTILIVVFFVGPVMVGWIGLYVSGAVLRWTGKWLKGQAPADHVRAALAWSWVPLVWSSVLWIPKLLLFGRELFTSVTPSISASRGLAMAYFGFGIVDTVVLVWGIVILLKSLGQVQGFSFWKVLLNLLLAVLILFVPIAIFSFLTMSANFG